MSQIVSQFNKVGEILRSLDVVSNRRAFIVLFFTFLAGLVEVALLSSLTLSLVSRGNYGISGFFALLGSVVIFLTMSVGISATGFLVNDRLNGREQKTIINSVIAAAITLHRLIGVAALLFVGFIALLILAVIALFVCKIPGIGPVFYAFVFPVCAIAFGSMFYVLSSVLLLSGPAIWNGLTVKEAAGTLIAIIRQRLISVLVNNLMLSIMVSLVVGFIAVVLFSGMFMTSGMSVAIIGHGGPGLLESMMMSLNGAGGGASGYLYAAGFGASVLIGCAMVIPSLIMLSGYCIIFQGATEGLSSANVKTAIEDVLTNVRESAKKAKEQIEDTRKNISVTAETHAPAAKDLCPACHSQFAAEDAFCMSCGAKLR